MYVIHLQKIFFALSLFLFQNVSPAFSLQIFWGNLKIYKTYFCLDSQAEPSLNFGQGKAFILPRKKLGYCVFFLVENPCGFPI